MQVILSLEAAGFVRYAGGKYDMKIYIAGHKVLLGSKLKEKGYADIVCRTI